MVKIQSKIKSANFNVKKIQNQFNCKCNKELKTVVEVEKEDPEEEKSLVEEAIPLEVMMGEVDLIGVQQYQ